MYLILWRFSLYLQLFFSPKRCQLHPRALHNPKPELAGKLSAGSLLRLLV